MGALLWLYRFLKYSRLTWNPAQLALLAPFQGLSASSIDVRDGSIRLRGTSIDVSPPSRKFLLHGIDQTADFLNSPDAQFTENGLGDVLLKIDGVQLLLLSWEELFIAHEVFHRGVYRVHLNQPYHAIDVGMNVATASLAFASDPLCKHVSAYELFPPTYVRAERNLSLNPEFAKKITAASFGLAREEADFELDYCPEVKGSTGLFGIAPHVRARERGLKIERIRARVRPARDELQRDVEAAGSHPVVCKIDCEGAEYEILDVLGETGLLGHMSVLMIEWHNLGPARIEARLKEAGFWWLSQEPRGVNHGMIYAWRNRI
jgi:FkbM family methyltransferase